MRRQAGLTALLLVSVGVVLGATVFRSDIAQATGLAQSVTIDNTTANPVPVREQNLDASGNLKVHEQGVVRDDHTNITFHAQTVSGQPPTNCLNDDIYTVPAGQQFVAQFVSIDHATGTSATTADQAILFNASQGGLADFASFVLAEGTLGRWAVSQMVDLVFPSGAKVGFQVQPDAATNPCLVNGASAAQITVGGYLEPTP
jgi:hypothetical protein